MVPSSAWMELGDVNGIAAAVAIPDHDVFSAASQQSFDAGIDLLGQNLAGNRDIDGLVTDAVAASIRSAWSLEVRHNVDFHRLSFVTTFRGDVVTRCLWLIVL